MKPTIVMVPTIYTEHNWRKQSVSSGLQCSKCVWKVMCWREARGSWLVARVSWLAGLARVEPKLRLSVGCGQAQRQDKIQSPPLFVFGPLVLWRRRK